MTNRDIASQFKLLSNLMDLHEENAFKIRSYANAYLTIRKLPQDLDGLSQNEISAIPGIGKAISDKIMELIETGKLKTLEGFIEKTPSGVIELLGIKGLGAKKIRQIWKELDITSPGELQYAINENRLVDLKGFGKKTQENIKNQLDYFSESSGKRLYAVVEDEMNTFIDELRHTFPDALTSATGEYHRRCTILSKLEILTTESEENIRAFCESNKILESTDPLKLRSLDLEFHYCKKEDFYHQLVLSSTSEGFMGAIEIQKDTYSSEEDVFTNNELPYYIAEFREDENIPYMDTYSSDSQILNTDDIKGCLHNHSTFSDGMNTLEEMLVQAKDKGFEYFHISDHSRSAFYANGLQIERLLQQLDEIQLLDQKYDDIKFFSGIESDILANGDLDYPDDILAQLDLVVASVHSNLNMDEEKATQRLLKAIENPYTSILGHPTGRLLLSRKGYPIDHKKIIDACADNNVAIELNANPLRLDLDWRFIQYAMEKNVLISINPDAHSIKGMNDIHYGVMASRKAALNRSYCLNAMDLEEFEEWLYEQHAKRAF